MANACEYENSLLSPWRGSSRASPRGTFLHCPAVHHVLWNGACCLDVAHAIGFKILLVLQVTRAMEEGSLVHSAMYVRQGVDPAR